jgi:hypothetical protein
MGPAGGIAVTIWISDLLVNGKGIGVLWKVNLRVESIPGCNATERGQILACPLGIMSISRIRCLDMPDMDVLPFKNAGRYHTLPLHPTAQQ